MLNESRIRELLSKLTHPDNKIPDGLSKAEIIKLSQKIDITLPKDFSSVLEITNAPYINGQVLLGVSSEDHRSLEAVYQMYPKWKYWGWLPIANDGCGNYYIIPTKNDFGEGYPVIFIESTINSETPGYIVASNVAIFIEFLIERELKMSRWPFDKQLLLSRDPNIQNYQNVNLPWE